MTLSIYMRMTQILEMLWMYLIIMRPQIQNQTLAKIMTPRMLHYRVNIVYSM